MKITLWPHSKQKTAVIGHGNLLDGRTLYIINPGLFQNTLTTLGQNSGVAAVSFPRSADVRNGFLCKGRKQDKATYVLLIIGLLCPIYG
jgi:hypothetical protein